MFAQAGFGGLGAQFGASAMLNGSIIAQQSSAYAGVQAGLGRYAPVVTAEQSAARQASESAAMLNTPGMRMIAEMRYRMTYDDSLKGNAEFQGAIKGLTSARTPQEQAIAFAAARKATADYGPVNLSNEALLTALQNSTHGVAFAEDMNTSVRNQVKGRNFAAEAKNISRDKRFRNFASAGGGDLMNTLTSTYSDTTRDAILSALGSGDIEKAKSLMGDPALLAAEGSSPEAVLNSFSKLSEAVGGAGNASNAIQQGVALLKHRGQLTNLVSQEALVAQNQAAAVAALQSMSAGSDTRASRKGLLRTVADNLLSGGGASLTEAQVFDYVNASGKSTGSMAISQKAKSFRLTDAQTKMFAGDADFMTSLGLSMGDSTGLDTLSASDHNIPKIQAALKAAGYKVHSSDGKTMQFMTDSEFAGFESSLVTDKTGELYSKLTGGSLTEAELAALSGGDPTAEGYNDARIKLTEAVDKKYGKDNSKELQKLARKGLIGGDEASTAATLAVLQGKVGNLSNKDRDEFFRGFAKDNREWLEKKTGTTITDDMINSGSTYKIIREMLRGEKVEEEGSTGVGNMTVNGNITVMGSITPG
jgi:hypothetical protein